MAKLKDLEPLIIAEWLKRPEEKRTESDILEFYGHLERNNSSILSFKVKGDKYQSLKTILRVHITR